MMKNVPLVITISIGAIATSLSVFMPMTFSSIDTMSVSNVVIMLALKSSVRSVSSSSRLSCCISSTPGNKRSSPNVVSMSVVLLLLLSKMISSVVLLLLLFGCSLAMLFVARRSTWLGIRFRARSFPRVFRNTPSSSVVGCCWVLFLWNDPFSWIVTRILRIEFLSLGSSERCDLLIYKNVNDVTSPRWSVPKGLIH